MWASSSLSVFLFVLLHLNGSLGQGPLPPRRTNCPTTTCPPCPTPPPFQPPPASPQKTAGELPIVIPPPPPPSTTPTVCECRFNVMNTCGQGDGSCKWELAFKAVKGNGRSVWTDFIDNNVINPNSPLAMVISSNVEPFKNNILLDWNKKLIKQVKVEVYNEGVRKAWFLFDGTASNRFNWFTQERLIASPYTNLKTDVFAFFSAIGVPADQTRFFINENDATCSEDCGYLAVVDTGANRCPWSKIEPQPYFLYSPDVDNCCVWNDATDCGDLVADIFFVIDVSGSIDATEFASLIDFVKQIIGALPAGADKTRFGAVSFSNSVKSEFKLNDFFTQGELQNAVDNIINLGGGTRTDLALRFLKDTAFLPINGNRPLVPDVVFVLTDGASSQAGETTNAINYIASENYLTFTIGIGSNLNTFELDQISSDPDSTYSLLADFSGLDKILDELIGSACRVAAPVRSAIIGQSPPDPADNKVGDVFAISVNTCEIGW